MYIAVSGAFYLAALFASKYVQAMNKWFTQSIFSNYPPFFYILLPLPRIIQKFT